MQEVHALYRLVVYRERRTTWTNEILKDAFKEYFEASKNSLVLYRRTLNAN